MAQLVNNESALKTYTYVADWKHIAANATSSNQVTIASIPAGGAVAFVYALEVAALTGASDITLDVGTTTGDPAEYIAVWDADSGTPAVNTGTAMRQSAATTTYEAGWTPAAPVTAATDILAEWNGTVASLTAGKCIVVVGIIDPGALA